MFQCMTLDSWSLLMYINMFGCDVIGYEDYPDDCQHPQASFIISALYFPLVVASLTWIIITMFIVATFLILVWLLFYVELPQASRDLINIMVGAYVAVLAKSTDYWFKEKDDPEHKESESIQKNGADSEY